MYQSYTWLQAILWTVVCSQDVLAISWLLAGYGPKSIHFKRESYNTMYQNWTWLQAILWIVVRSWDFWTCISDGPTAWLSDGLTDSPTLFVCYYLLPCKPSVNTGNISPAILIPVCSELAYLCNVWTRVKGHYVCLLLCPNSLSYNMGTFFRNRDFCLCIWDARQYQNFESMGINFTSSSSK